MPFLASHEVFALAGSLLRNPAATIEGVELLAKIVRRITGAAPIVIAIGCQGPRVDKNPPKPAAVVEHAPKQDSTSENEPKQLGSFDITFYYVIGEDEIKPAKKLVAANDNEPELAAIAPQPNPGPDPV